MLLAPLEDPPFDVIRDVLAISSDSLTFSLTTSQHQCLLIRHHSLTRTESVFAHCFKDIHVSNVSSSAKVGFCHGCILTGFLIWITSLVVAVAARGTAIRSDADFSCDGRSADRDSQRQSKRIFVGSLSKGSGRQCASTKQPEPSFPLCAFCGCWDRGVLRTAIFSGSVAMAMSGSTCPAPICEAARTGTVSLITSTVYGKGQEPNLCVVRWWPRSGSDPCAAASVSGTLPFLVQESEGAESFVSVCSCALRDRQPNPSRTAASLSSASTNVYDPPL